MSEYDVELTEKLRKVVRYECRISRRRALWLLLREV